MPLRVAHIQHRHKQAWEQLRTLQGAPTLHIKRLSWTGRDLPQGIKGTETDAGLADVDCSWSDLNAEELVQHGLQMESGARTFVVYDLAGGYEVRLTDLVQYPTTDADAIWEIKKVGGSTIGSGRVEIFVTKRRTA